MLGKNHHHRRRRGESRAWLRIHFPLTAARLDGDWELHALLCAEREERDRENAQLIRICPYCGALMIYRGCSIWTCPYEIDGAHELAREYYSRARGFVGEVNRPEPSPSAPASAPRGSGLQQEVNDGYLADSATA